VSKLNLFRKPKLQDRYVKKKNDELLPITRHCKNQLEIKKNNKKLLPKTLYKIKLKSASIMLHPIIRNQVCNCELSSFFGVVTAKVVVVVVVVAVEAVIAKPFFTISTIISFLFSR
jgi:hypothetical protein